MRAELQDRLDERDRTQARLECALRAYEEVDRSLEARTAQHATVMETLADGVITADEAGEIDYANPAAERIFGYGAGELLSQNIRLLMTEPEHDPRAASGSGSPHEHAQDGGGEFRDVVGLRKDGRRFPVRRSISESLVQGRRLFTAVVQDVTARQEALEALKESETRFRQLAEHVREVFLLSDAKLERTIYVNRAFESIWGRPVEQLYQSPRCWQDAIDPADRPRVMRAVRDAAQRGRFDEQYRIQRGDGSTRWIHDRRFPIRDADGRLTRFAGILEDITGRKQIETALLSANAEADAATRAKSEFLAMMSHELRTPLNGVVGMTELLLGTNLNPQQQRYASLAKSSADMLLALINDILDFSKIECGRLELEQIEFDLHDTIESVTTSFAARAESQGLELIHGIHPDVPRLVRGDPGRLQQILMNLVSNAIKFTERGEVSARVMLAGQAGDEAVLRFTVTDTGIGIPKDRIGSLFTSFTQADSSTTRRFGGTGLGLAIARQLATLMGGETGVMSEEGTGSSFWFTARLTRIADKARAAGVGHDSLRGLRVLIVDDNATNREVLCEQLTNWKLAHAVATNGQEALAALRAAAAAGTPFGLAILDMHMPGMDGRTLAKAIRAEAAIADPVMILLSSLETGDLRELRAIGFASCLSKPVRPSKLLEAIVDAVTNEQRASSLEPLGETSGAGELHARAGSKGARILLAEDHEISQEVASTILRRAGYACDVASNGRQALEALQSREYDLVLMDCHMPEMDGFQATGAIRSAEAARQSSGDRLDRIPIIALTANAIRGDRERCLAAGMDDYLTKPLEPRALLETIERRLRTGPRGQATSSASEARQPSTIPAAERPRTGPAGPFDVSGMSKRWGGDRAFVYKLIQKFCAQAPPEVDQLQQRVAAGDAEESTRLAHRLKGAASYVGAAAFQQAAAELEALARNGALSDAPRLMDTLRSELERCLGWQLDETGRDGAAALSAEGEPCES
jgi:PAS domain S-box-containing protein